MPVTMNASGGTDVGRGQKDNEHALLVAKMAPGASHPTLVGDKGVLLAVADGMAGELASVRAADILRRQVPGYAFTTLAAFYASVDGQ